MKGQPNITQEALIDAGFRKEVGEHYVTLQGTDTIFSKKVRFGNGDSGVKYHISINFYPAKSFSFGQGKDDISVPDSYEFHAQLSPKSEEVDCFNVSYYPDTIQEGEAFIERLFNSMDCDPEDQPIS